MQCAKCGNEVDSNEKCCHVCGAELHRAGEEAASHDQSTDLPRPLVGKKPMPLWFKALIFISFLALIGVSAGLLFTESLVDVADKQLEALRRGDIDEAYKEYTSKAFRQVTSLEQFQQYVAKHPILMNYHSVLFNQRTIKDQLSILRGRLTNVDHSSNPIEYRLIKEEGKWKVLSLKLSKAKGAYSEKKMELVNLAKYQLRAIAQGDIEQAWEEYSSADFKMMTSLDDFEKLLNKYSVLRDRTLTSFFNPTLQDQFGTLAVVLQSKDYSIFVKYDFIFENNEWKIQRMRILSPFQSEERSQNRSEPSETGIGDTESN